MCQITIEGLFLELKKQIDNSDDLECFYIGKAKDVSQRAQQHNTRDNLPITVILATGKEEIIIEGEKYLEKKFLEDSRCLNKHLGGGPEESPFDNIYFSYRRKALKRKTIEDLSDEEFEWNNKYLLVK